MGWTMLNVFTLGLPWLICKMFDIKTPTERHLENEDLIFVYKIVLKLRPRTATERKVVRTLDRLFPSDRDEWEKAYTLLMEGKEFRFMATSRQYQICLAESGDDAVFSKVSVTNAYDAFVVLNGERVSMLDRGYCPSCLNITLMGYYFDGSECYDCSNTDNNIPFDESLTNSDVRRIEKYLSSPKAVKAAEEREAARAESKRMLHEAISQRGNYH